MPKLRYIVGAAIAVIIVATVYVFWFALGHMDDDPFAPSSSVVDAQHRGTFVRPLMFPDSLISFNGNVVRIREAWIEHDAEWHYYPFWPNRLQQLSTYSAILNTVDTTGASSLDTDRVDSILSDRFLRRNYDTTYDFGVTFLDSTHAHYSVASAAGGWRQKQLRIGLRTDPHAYPQLGGR